MNECLIEINFEEDSFTFCFNYLSWKEALDYEAKAHQISEQEYIFNSEKEKRE